MKYFFLQKTKNDGMHLTETSKQCALPHSICFSKERRRSLSLSHNSLSIEFTLSFSFSHSLTIFVFLSLPFSSAPISLAAPNTFLPVLCMSTN